MSNYTTGPWAYDGNGRIDAVEFRTPTGYICDDGSEYIGGLVALPYHCGDGTAEANARLIAAAPDLLDALQELVAENGDFYREDRHLAALDKAKAAISKALGEVEQIEEAA